MLPFMSRQEGDASARWGALLGLVIVPVQAPLIRRCRTLVEEPVRPSWRRRRCCCKEKGL